MELEGAAAVVTGGASGLGEATARRLLERGAQVLLLDRDGPRVRKAADELGCAWAEADLGDDAAVQAALEAAGALGELRVLVSCAGIAHGQTRTVRRDGTPHDMTAWRQVVEVNLIGTYNVCRLFAAAVATSAPREDGERGAIVLTASCAAFDGQQGQTAYAAAKAGLAGMTLPLARDLKPLGIRVNTIAPGVFDTPMLHPEGLSPEAEAAITRRNAEFLPDLLFPGRVGRPEEFAALVEHLVTNPYLNAEVVRLDGGLRLSGR